MEYLIPKIGQQCDVMVEKQIAARTQFQHSNRASNIGEKCERKLVYYRTIPDKAKPISTYLAGIFQTGNELEPIIERILGDIGRSVTPRWRIVGKGTAVGESGDRLFKKYNITGSTDGILEVESETCKWYKSAVADIKTCSPHIFDTIVEDSLESLDRYFWTMKYYDQMQIYMLGTNLDWSVLIFVNKQNLFQIKLIRIPLDYEYAEGLLKKAERINKAVDSNVLPPKLNQPGECSRCQFAHKCMPDLESSGNMELNNDSEIEELLQARAELQPAKKAFDAVERKLKGKLVAGQDFICGDFIVEWKKIIKKAYEVKASEYYTKKVLCTKQDKQEADDVA